MLAQAKVDFQLARHGRTPQYAKYAHMNRSSHSKVYEGQGYRLTIVHQDSIYPHEEGPDILLYPRITGGEPYHYDEVDSISY